MREMVLKLEKKILFNSLLRVVLKGYLNFCMVGMGFFHFNKPALSIEFFQDLFFLSFVVLFILLEAYLSYLFFSRNLTEDQESRIRTLFLSIDKDRQHASYSTLLFLIRRVVFAFTLKVLVGNSFV